MTGPLAQLAGVVREVNEANGWHDGERSFGDDIALLHSEVSEAFEEYRDGSSPTENRYVLNYKPGTTGADLIDAYLGEDEGVPDEEYGRRVNKLQADHPELFKPEGIPSELADILIRLLDTAGRLGVDLDEAVREKLAFNRTRGHRHGGKVV